ncbi:hypothetical protein KBC79_01975 [Candidatus Woesebacteria bacterium]|nr:hypothetical protein [Candidatus Woesebacteria bacterium]
MKNLVRIACALLLAFSVIFGGVFSLVVSADEVQDLQRQIDELANLRRLSEDATKPLEDEVDTLESRIANARAGIERAKQESAKLSETIDKRELALSHQYTVLSKRIFEQYKKTRTYTPFLAFISTTDASVLTKDLAYRSSVKAQDNRLIHDIGSDIVQLEADKKKLESDQKQLAALEQQLDEQADFFKGEISKAKTYQKELSGKIAVLSAQQQAILAARSGSTTTSAGNVPIGSDFDGSIAGFRANAPSGSFAVFSFGAHTHRKGMSQYGAKARADSGQNYKEILKSYYGKEPADKDTGGSISVSGVGSISFEDQYLYGIAEMPSDWPVEALKAQAVAARTYAYRYKQDGKSICTTEACQVYSGSKAANPPENWKKAVQETRGQVLEDVVTYYSSTSGGYLTTSGWDTTDKNGSGDWTSRAWESKGNSPWFYKAWYRQGYRNDSSSCGRKPWLSEEEMADILNAWLLRKDPKGADTGRILPVTIGSCAVGGQSGSPYSMEEVRGLVGNPVTSISGTPVVSHNDSGQTVSVKFQTNRGELTFSGLEFKEAFNTRAPGYISIPQSGFAFFNIERK